ncbi:MAG: MFS transporter [Micropruina glycogenica]
MVLFVGALLLGLGNGGIDVAMNAIGVQVEAARPKPIMSFFHGMWSVGNFAGAALVYIAALSVPSFAVQAAVLVATVVGVAACVLAVRITPETAVVTHADETGAKTPIPRWAYLLGLMAIAFGLGEGTAMDWSGLHVTEVAGIPAAQGSLAVAVVAGFMVAIRLLGDALVARFGRRAVVRFGGACSALGYLITAIATPLPVLLIGWAMVGFGIGMIAPQVYAVAGHAAGGRGLAVVVTFGYATFLCGPAVIGFLAAHFGLQHTMFVPAVLLACLPFLASVMPADERPAPIS